MGDADSPGAGTLDPDTTADEQWDRDGRDQPEQSPSSEVASLLEIPSLLDRVVTALSGVHGPEAVTETVCEAFVRCPAVDFAWLGSTNPAGSTGRADASAAATTVQRPPGVCNGSPSTDHPVSVAAATASAQVVSDLAATDTTEAWAVTAVDGGYRSLCVAPLVFREVTYGVLACYGTTPAAFPAPWVDVVDALGDAIALALAQHTQTDALASLPGTRLVFETYDADLTIAHLASLLDCRVMTLDAAATNERHLVRYVVRDASREAIEAVLADLGAVTLESCIEHADGTCRVRVEQPIPVRKLVAAHGGYVERLRADEATVRIEVRVPTDADPALVFDAMTARYPSTDLVRILRSTDELDATGPVEAVLDSALTDRQREVLVAAYETGYIAWPRETGGREVAAQLNISQPTFNQHLWRGLQRLFAAATADFE